MKYTNKEHTFIDAGNNWRALRFQGQYIPCVPGNSDYERIVREGLLGEVLPWAPDLAQERSAASQAIMQATGSARTKYAINTDHQSTIYDVKSQEADAYVAAGRPEDTSPYPVLVASASANSRTVSLHAEIIRAKRDVWVAIAAETERLREAGLNAVKVAETYEDILATRDSYVAQLGAL